ncbi:hypothetical protein HUN01_06830 [Nostoc edaphicum CCNP1411]|uniref:Uncharacterized protein n=1 Tax=Nostoc edaphicum CCNP1411 TaxID=1472755 RepID=A0A7D7LC82_9NOSO|nr:hypothetical protein [Nostoc edaphicum]QMS87311.1 hypothetical protein HUN01_06830 [Nostoc edaphicum CCNP1411]
MPYEQYDKLIGVVNDPRDFKMPYRIFGKIELEVMKNKYQRLNNKSKALSVRFVK